VRAPLAREPFALPLLDSMRRDLMEDQRAERTIETPQNLAVPIGAALVQVRMVAEVNLRELSKRDVGLSPNAVTASRMRERSFASMSRAWCLSAVAVVFRYLLPLI
jgi:hypothetical protein